MNLKMASILYYIRHYIFVVLYFFNVIFSSINIYFPLYIIKLTINIIRHGYNFLEKKVAISKFCVVIYIYNFWYGYTFFNQIITNVFFFLCILELWSAHLWLCQLINMLIIKMQSFITVLLKFAGTDIYVYQEKDKLLKDCLVEGSIVTMPNHLSELDTLYIGSLYNYYYPTIHNGKAFAKSAIRFYPFIGWLLLTSDVIFVQNRNKESNSGQYDYIENKLLNNKEAPSQTTIFIEGVTFDNNIRLERNNSAEKLLSPIYDNVLVPRTTGIYLVEKNINVTNEVYVSMKFTNQDRIPFPPKYYNLNLLQLFYAGYKPQQVHLLARPKIYDRSDISDREKFNQRIYQNFKLTDESLNDSLEQWEEKYHKEKIQITIVDLVITVILLAQIVISFYLFVNNRLYLLYFVMACVIYVIMGLMEHKNIIPKEKKKND